MPEAAVTRMRRARASLSATACTALAATLLAAALFAALPAARAASDAGPYETVPDQPPAALLPAALVSGESFHVVDPVHGDGLMYHYVIDSRYGSLDAYGRAALTLRVREVAALDTLAKTSSVGIVAGGVAHGVESEVKTAVGVVTNPVKTVTGIPKGIAHLFHGYGARGEELAAKAQGSGHGGTSGGTNVVREGGAAARSYAERYLGITAAERGWYRRLGVSPYTDNSVLRDAVRRAAKTEAVGSFGAKFAGLPAIPGLALTERAVDAIYNEDPAAVRQRTRRTLAEYGLAPAEIDSWLNAPLLNPARQVVLLSVAEQLDGVEGRGELFRHALGLISDPEVQVYLLSAGLLLEAHRMQHLERIVPGVRLPAALRADGRLIVCGAFEAVYWTEDVAQSEAVLRLALSLQAWPPAQALQPAQVPSGEHELWLLGTVSQRARDALAERGWVLHEVPAAS